MNDLTKINNNKIDKKNKYITIEPDIFLGDGDIRQYEKAGIVSN